MKLDRTTYEAWLLDRIEGRLSQQQDRELDAFLAANPDLRADSIEMPTIDDTRATFDAKGTLKKNYPPTGTPDASRLNDFLVALMEGDLTEEQEEQLDRFLYEHQEVQHDVKAMAASKAQGGTIRFNQKTSVERHFPPQGLPDKHRLTDFLIAAQEGDLTSEQRAALDGYLSEHPAAQREQRLIAATHVRTEHIVYSDKEQLKKREVRVVALWQRLAAAASIALLVGLAWWLLRDKPSNEVEVAHIEQHAQPAPQPVPQVRKEEPPMDNVAKTSDGNNSAKSARALREIMEQREEQRPRTPQQEKAPAPSLNLSPAPEPQLANGPTPTQPAPDVKVPPEDKDPALAQKDPSASDGVKDESVTGSNVGMLLTNAIRANVLNAPQRAAGPDESDALALVNKGLGAITNGDGHLQVERTSTRKHWQLRLGRGFSVSASAATN